MPPSSSSSPNWRARSQSDCVHDSTGIGSLYVNRCCCAQEHNRRVRTSPPCHSTPSAVSTQWSDLPKNNRRCMMCAAHFNLISMTEGLASISLRHM